MPQKPGAQPSTNWSAPLTVDIPIIAAATLPFLTTSRSCIFRPIPQNSIRRKTSGMNSAKKSSGKPGDAQRIVQAEALVDLRVDPQFGALPQAHAGIERRVPVPGQYGSPGPQVYSGPGAPPARERYPRP
jgi:hypothetical protein